MYSRYREIDAEDEVERKADAAADIGPLQGSRIR
jgi:hypothetical protein